MKKLFFTALLQVSLVSMNVTFISHGMIIPMLVTGFGISFVWSWNVKRIAIGNLQDRLVYALGAMTGTGIGYILAKLFTQIL